MSISVGAKRRGYPCFSQLKFPLLRWLRIYDSLIPSWIEASLTVIHSCISWYYYSFAPSQDGLWFFRFSRCIQCLSRVPLQNHWNSKNQSYYQNRERFVITLSSEGCSPMRQPLWVPPEINLSWYSVLPILFGAFPKIVVFTSFAHH